MVRLLHHAHTRTRPDPFTFAAGALTPEDRDVYIPPGAPTVIAPFIVAQDFVTAAETRVQNTSQEATWSLIRDMCKLNGLKSLQVQVKTVTGNTGKTHHILAPRLHVMIAGAPVLSTIVAAVPAVLETKVLYLLLHSHCSAVVTSAHLLRICASAEVTSALNASGRADSARDCRFRFRLSSADWLGGRVRRCKDCR